MRVDPSEIEQIVINLVVNACDAMEGEGQVDVTLARGRQGRVPAARAAADYRAGTAGAILTVADNGPGMPAGGAGPLPGAILHDQAPGSGSGLGMTTVYGLVTERGGHMDIDSDPTGTTDPHLAAPVRGAPSPSGTTVTLWPPGQTIAGRILLVEDEPDLRLMAQESLTSIGLEVAGGRVGRAGPGRSSARRGRSTPW